MDAASPATPEIMALDADESVAAGACLLDVREPEEFEAGHAPDAWSIPLGSLAQRAGELPRDVTLVCVCRSGHRSEAAVRALREAGFEAANLVGGMFAWQADGLPVVNATGAPGRVI